MAGTVAAQMFRCQSKQVGPGIEPPLHRLPSPAPPVCPLPGLPADSWAPVCVGHGAGSLWVL